MLRKEWEKWNNLKFISYLRWSTPNDRIGDLQPIRISIRTDLFIGESRAVSFTLYLFRFSGIYTNTAIRPIPTDRQLEPEQAILVAAEQRAAIKYNDEKPSHTIWKAVTARLVQ